MIAMRRSATSDMTSVSQAVPIRSIGKESQLFGLVVWCLKGGVGSLDVWCFLF